MSTYKEESDTTFNTDFTININFDEFVVNQDKKISYVYAINFSWLLTEISSNTIYNRNMLECLIIEDSPYKIILYNYLPPNIKTLGVNCFANCTSLEEIYLPSTLTELSNECFYSCTSLKEYIFACIERCIHTSITNI